jgi:hypothetical protein
MKAPRTINSHRTTIAGTILTSALVLSFTTASLVGPAMAQPKGPAGAASAPAAGSSKPISDEAKKEAGERFKRGVKLQEEGNPEAAIIEFERAYQLAPNYRVLYNIGVIYRDRGDKANALRTFEKYLADGGSEIDAKRRKEVEADVVRLRDVVAQVTLKVTPPGVEVTIDDNPVLPGQINQPILVNVGRRRFEATKEGYTSQSKFLTLAGGDKVVVELTLKEIKAQPATTVILSSAPPPPTAPPPPRSSAPPAAPTNDGSGQRTAGYIIGGVGLAGLAAGSIFGLVARSKWSSVDGKCVKPAGGTVRICPDSDSQDTAKSAQSMAAFSTFGFALGGVAVVVGASLLLSAPSATGASASRAPGLQFSPFLGKNNGGLFVDGAF